MTIGEFRQYVKKWGKGQDPVKLLFPLDRLELLPADRKRKTHAVDHRSFIDSDGYWNIYPIAIDSFHVYIVCPYCQQIHIHGNDKGLMKAPDAPIVSHKLKTINFEENLIKTQHEGGKLK